MYLNNPLGYLFDSIHYLLSPSYRKKKKKEWASKSSMFKIHEVGMWITVLSILLLLIIALAVAYTEQAFLE